MVMPFLSYLLTIFLHFTDYNQNWIKLEEEKTSKNVFGTQQKHNQPEAEINYF